MNTYAVYLICMFIGWFLFQTWLSLWTVFSVDWPIGGILNIVRILTMLFVSIIVWPLMVLYIIVRPTAFRRRLIRFLVPGV